MTTNIEQRISRARTHLLMDQPWFGSLALRLRMEATPGLGTFANDGTHLKYDPDYAGQRSDKEMIGVIAHEVMHCAMGHMYRAGNRNWRKWNEACDIAINGLLRAQGFVLPPTFLQAEEAQYAGMSAEQIYAAREKAPPPAPKGAGGSQKGQPGQGSGEGQSDDDHHDGDSCACGMQPAPKGSAAVEGQLTEVDWQIATEQATAVAKKAGTMPAHIDRAISANPKTHTDWRSILRRFIEQTVPSDYSWMSPKRRHIAQGLYLPGMVKENMPRIGLAVDTSGSVDAAMLQQFASELTAILHETRPEALDVVYCDAKVQGKETFTPDDGEVVLHAKGGGGTAFQPALDVFNDDPPCCVIYLTDLYGPAPKEPTAYPVLWATPEDNTQLAPFGELVRLSKWEQ